MRRTSIDIGQISGIGRLCFVICMLSGAGIAAGSASRSCRNLRTAERTIFFAPAGTAAHCVERPQLASAVWLLRSRAEPDCAEPADGPAGRPAICGGVCSVPRDAARQASDAAVGLQPDFTFAGISRGRKAIRTFPLGEEVSGQVGGVVWATAGKQEKI